MNPGSTPSGASLLDPQFLRLLERLTIHIQGRIRGGGLGERRSTLRGSGGDFADMRPYTSGDDLRHLDWHLFARLDSLFVRLYEEPREHTIHLLVDTSASMACGKAWFTRQLAAALSYIALSGQDRLGVFPIGDGLVGSLGPLRGKPSAHRVLSFLETMAFSGQTDLERAVRAFIATRARGTVILMSDFLVPEGRAACIKLLAQKRYRVVVLHLLSPDERNPPLGREMTFVDAETGEQLLISVDKNARDAYLHELKLLTDELHQTCRAYGFACLDIDTGASLEELILGPLSQRGVLGRLGRV